MAHAEGVTNQGLYEALRVDVRPRFDCTPSVRKELGETVKFEKLRRLHARASQCEAQQPLPCLQAHRG